MATKRLLTEFMTLQEAESYLRAERFEPVGFAYAWMSHDGLINAKVFISGATVHVEYFA